MHADTAGKLRISGLVSVKGEHQVTTVLVIICILFCIGVIVAVVGHLGWGITRDKAWRFHIRRHHRTKGRAGTS